VLSALCSGAIPSLGEIRNCHINVGTGKELTIREFSELMVKAVGFDGEVAFYATNPTGPPQADRREQTPPLGLGPTRWKSKTASANCSTGTSRAWNKKTMNRQELFSKIHDIEWDDFEAKSARTDVPKNFWETVCSFANTGGGWILLGVAQHGKQFEIEGVDNPEKEEQDVINTLRGGEKFSTFLAFRAELHKIDGKHVLAFYIESSPNKPVYFNGTLNNTFVRKGSSDQRATDSEIAAMLHDASFGWKSEETIKGTSFKDINPASLASYRQQIRAFDESFLYNGEKDREFCEKTGIMENGLLTYGGLLMLGKRESVRRYVSNFFIDYLVKSSSNGFACGWTPPL